MRLITTNHHLSKLFTPIILLTHHHPATSFSATSMAHSSKVISVTNAGYHPVNGIYHSKSPSIIPAGFDKTCQGMNWNTRQMWNQLSDSSMLWFKSDENDSYIYWNKGDGKWFHLGREYIL